MREFKKIVWRLCIFLLPFIIVFSYCEYQLRHQPFASSYAAKKFYLEQQLDSTEILVLGSSQAYHGINPACFSKKCFNLANVSQTLYYDRRLTQQYLQRLPHLKTVIINIAYFSFFYQLYDIKEKWRDDYYNAHFSIRYYQTSPFDLSNYLLLSTYRPMHTAKLLFHQFVDDDAKQIMPNGFLPKLTQDIIDDSTGAARVKIHNDENFIKRRKEIVTDLDELVKELKVHQIQVVFVTTPVYKTYSRFCNDAVIDSNTKFINQLCKQYNCSYYNFFSDNRFLQEDFYDNDHLKYNGANKLSKLLNDTLLYSKNN